MKTEIWKRVHESWRELTESEWEAFCQLGIWRIGEDQKESFAVTDRGHIVYISPTTLLGLCMAADVDKSGTVVAVKK